MIGFRKPRYGDFDSDSTSGDGSIDSQLSDLGVRPEPRPQSASADHSPSLDVSGSSSAVTTTLVSSSSSGGGFASEAVTLAGSGLTFINTYDASVGSAYRTAIL